MFIFYLTYQISSLANWYMQCDVNTDGSNKDLNDLKGKSQSFNDPGNTPGVIMPFGS
jgi:ABC-type phosphate/phosphonate transport system substrate-binding protein